jgi:hypothetical protein
MPSPINSPRVQVTRLPWDENGVFGENYMPQFSMDGLSWFNLRASSTHYLAIAEADAVRFLVVTNSVPPTGTVVFQKS